VTWAQTAAVAAIGAYQRFLSPVLGGQCRFAPSCSEYARLAVAEHGVGRGVGLATWRLLRCHPFHPGGIDPPPLRRRE
jgi:putative membrane protein insertion efficiency factor